jgi:hypothetical protein
VQVQHLAEQHQAGLPGQHGVHAHEDAEQPLLHEPSAVRSAAYGTTEDSAPAATAFSPTNDGIARSLRTGPGVTYRPVRDAPPVAVQPAWWRDSPPPALADLMSLLCRAYGSAPAADPRSD